MNYNQKREKKVLGFIEKIKIPIKLISSQKNYDFNLFAKSKEKCKQNFIFFLIF